MHVNLTTGTAFSHEDGQGGGVLWLIERERKLKGKEAIEFLRDFGFESDAPAPKQNGHDHSSKIVETYDYVDESGKLLFQVLRMEPKTFRQRRPEGHRWVWSIKGVRQVPYRLPEITEAIAMGRLVIIVEGEKDVNRLWSLGVPATTNAGGSSIDWTPEFAEPLHGADVAIVPDNDAPGHKHARQVARALKDIAASVRVVELPGLEPKGDFSDWLDAGNGIGAFRTLYDAAPEWTPGPDHIESKFGGKRWEDIALPTATNGYTWLVEDIVPMNEITLAFGDSGTGKSFAIFDMAMCVARGITFAGHNVEQGLVVYVAAEAGKGFSKRKLAYTTHHDLSPGMSLPFYLCTKRPDFFTADTDVDNLIAETEAVIKTYKQPLKLTVFDTLSAMAPGMNENASQDVSKVRSRLVRFNEHFNAATILVHHKPKGGSTPRGHGSLTADFETTIEFETIAEKLHRAIVRKQREGKSGIFWDFKLPIVIVGKNKWGNDETSCVVEPFVGQRATASGGFHATPNELVFLEALFESINDYGCMPPSGLPEAIVKAVDISRVRETMKGRVITGETDSTKADQRFRQNFKRAADGLKAGKVIGYRQPLVWYTGKPVNGLSARIVEGVS